MPWPPEPDDDVEPAGDGGPTLRTPLTMYFDSSAVYGGCCVLFSRSELFKTCSFLVGSGVSSRDVRVVRRRSKPESPSILVCLFSSWIHSEVFFLRSFSRRLVSNPKDEKRLKILFFLNSIFEINFNKISFSLDTSKKLHFAAKTFHFLSDPLPVAVVAMSLIAVKWSKKEGKLLGKLFCSSVNEMKISSTKTFSTRPVLEPIF